MEVLQLRESQVVGVLLAIPGVRVLISRIWLHVDSKLVSFAVSANKLVGIRNHSS